MSESTSTGTEAKKKFSFKMPSAIVILVSILFGLVVLSWILSWSGVSYDGTGVQAMGLFGGLTAMSQGFINGSDLIFYLFVLGAVIELMLVSGSMEAGISGLVKGFNGKELFLIPILVVLFSAGGMIYGMSEETIALFVIVVPALSLAGFDAVVGMMVILGGTATGCAMSVVNPFNVGAAAGAINDVLNNGTAGNAYNQGVTLIPTLIWWIILTAITATAVTGYAWMVKKSPEKSVNKAMKAETDEWLKGFGGGETEQVSANGRQKAALAVFMVSFALMIILFIPWPDVLGLGDSWYYPGDGTYTVPGWAKIFAPLVGLIAPLGWWYFGELSGLFILSGTIIALILGMGMKKTSDTAWAGAKEMFSIAIVIGIARGIPVILEATGMQTVLVGGMISGLGGLSPMAFLYISFFIMLLLSTVITSTSGLAGATMGLFAASIFGSTGTVGASGDIVTGGLASGWGMTNSEALAYMGAIVIVYMMAIGIMNFFVPSNPIVMASMAQSRVAYGDGVKVMAPLAGIMLAITLIAIIPSLALLY